MNKTENQSTEDGPAETLAVTAGSASVTSAEDLACFWETRAHHREGCGYSDSAYAFRCCADDLRRLMRPSTVSRQGTAAKQHRPPIDPDHYLTWAAMQLKADMFDYLCWLEDFCQFRQAALDGKAGDYLVMASDGTTCWGKTYAEAVRVAMEHDKEIHDATEAVSSLNKVDVAKRKP